MNQTGWGQSMKRVQELEAALSEAYNGCGVAATFLEFHGRPSKQLTNCIEQMRKLEKRGEQIYWKGKKQ